MDYMSEYKRWLDCSALSADEHAELAAVADNQEEIESRFFAPLSFGTAGLRGVLGVGLNRMNRFTVGQAAQGLANLIVSNGQAAMDRGVAIAYDSRHFSAEFAKQSACIMAANGIQSLLFDELRPTRSCPSLSVTTAASQASTSRLPTTRRNTTATRFTGRTAHSFLRPRQTWLPAKWQRPISSPV